MRVKVYSLPKTQQRLQSDTVTVCYFAVWYDWEPKTETGSSRLWLVSPFFTNDMSTESHPLSFIVRTAL